MPKFVIPSDDEDAKIKRGIALDPDNPEADEDFFRRARPLREFPGMEELAERLEAQSRPRRRDAEATEPVSVERRVVERFRAQGPDWPERLNAVLRRAVGLD